MVHVSRRWTRSQKDPGSNPEMDFFQISPPDATCGRRIQCGHSRPTYLRTCTLYVLCTCQSTCIFYIRLFNANARIFFAHFAIRNAILAFSTPNFDLLYTCTLHKCTYVRIGANSCIIDFNHLRRNFLPN